LTPLSLGESLRLLRHRAKIGRDQLAKLVGVSTGAISNYENDVSMPAASTLRRLSAAFGQLLGCPPAELWGQFGQILDGAAASESPAVPAVAAGS
jgi:transcriptional regulator with XRE-family HTH domain